jgi:hypothetical protein
MAVLQEVAMAVLLVLEVADLVVCLLVIMLLAKDLRS